MLRILLFLIVVGIVACSPKQQNIPEPNYHPLIIKPYERVEAQGVEVSLDSVMCSRYVATQGTYIKAGEPEVDSIDLNYQPAITPQPIYIAGEKINIDSVAPPAYIKTQGRKVIPHLPKKIPTQPISYSPSFYPISYLNLGLSAVRAMLEDRFGRIWFGDYYDGINIWDGKELVHYTTKNGLLSNFVDCLFQDSKGNIWIGTSAGLTVWDGNQFTHFLEKKSIGIYAICEDLNGHIWVGTSKGLYVWDGKGFYHYTEKNDIPESYTYIWSIIRDNDGNMIIGNGHGIVVWDGKDFTKYHLNNFTRKLINDQNNHIWIGTWNDGAYYWDGKAFYHYKAENGLMDNFVWDFLKDREGKIWMISHSHLSVFDGKGFANYQPEKGLPTGFYRSIIQDHSGRIWLGGDNIGEAIIWNEKGVNNFEIGEKWKNLRSLEVMEDSKGRKWIAITNRGVVMVEKNKRSRYTKENGLISNDIIKLFEDSKENIWIAAAGGISVFDGRGFRNFTNKDGLRSYYIQGFLEDREGRIWISYGNKGFDIWDGKGFRCFLTKIRGIKSDVINAINDSHNNLWIGTYYGLLKWDGNKMIQYTKEGGLSSSYVIGIRADKAGNIWIATLSNDKSYEFYISIFDGKRFLNFESIFNGDIKFIGGDNEDCWNLSFKGLTNIKYKEGNLYIEQFSHLDGFKGVNLKQGIIDQKKCFWIVSKNVIIESRLQPDTLKPLIFLQEINPFFDRIDWRQLKDTLGKGGHPTLGENKIPLSKVRYDSVFRFTNLPVDPSFPHNMNQLTLNWSAAYSAPHKVQYSYFLQGKDRSWSPLVSDSKVTYTNLPPGEYTYKIRAVNGNGKWSDTASYTFSVRAPWYWAWWSKSIYGMLFIGSILGFYRTRINRIRKEYRLQQQTQDSEMKALRAQMNPHFLFNSLNSINASILRSENEKASDSITLFASLMRQILDNSSQETILIETEVAFLKAYLQTESLRLENKLCWNLTVAPDMDISETEIPSMILQPFVENAIWHGISPKPESGKISIDIRKEAQTLVCTIEDDGIGREAAAKIRQKRIGKHESKGEKITLERLSLYDQKNGTSSAHEVIDLTDGNGKALGTQVILKIGLKS